MAALQPIAPHFKSGQTVTTGAASASVTINENSLNVIVTNTGTEPAYICLGESSATATATDFIVLAGDQVSITKSTNQDTLAYLQYSATTTTLHIMTGEGWV